MNLITCMMTNSNCYKNAGPITKVTGIVVHDTGAGNPNVKRYVQPSDDDPNYSELLVKLGKNSNKNDWNHTDREAGVHAFIGKLANGTVGTVHVLPYDKCAWGVGRGRLVLKGTQTYLDKQCSLLGDILKEDILGGDVASANGNYYIPVKVGTKSLYCKAEAGQSYNFNPNARLQFEICDDKYESEEYFSIVMKEAQEYCATLCIDNKLDPMTQICSHYEAYNAGYGCNHNDCDAWLEKYGKDMNWFRKEVKKLVDASTKYYNIDISYVYEDGTVAATSKHKCVKEGSKFCVKSPTIDGYTASAVEIMDKATEDKVYTVTYTAVKPKKYMVVIPNVNNDFSTKCALFFLNNSYSLGGCLTTVDGSAVITFGTFNTYDEADEKVKALLGQYLLAEITEIDAE